MKININNHNMLCTVTVLVLVVESTCCFSFFIINFFYNKNYVEKKCEHMIGDMGCGVIFCGKWIFVVFCTLSC